MTGWLYLLPHNINLFCISQCRSIAVKTVPFKTLENFVGVQQINLIFYETFRFLLIFWRLLTPRQNMEKLDTRQPNGLLHLLKVPMVPFILIWWSATWCQHQPVLHFENTMEIRVMEKYHLDTQHRVINCNVYFGDSWVLPLRSIR